MGENKVEQPRTSAGGFASGEEGGRFGGGSESPGHVGDPEEQLGDGDEAELEQDDEAESESDGEAETDAEGGDDDGEEEAPPTQ